MSINETYNKNFSYLQIEFIIINRSVKYNHHVCYTYHTIQHYNYSHTLTSHSINSESSYHQN